MHHVITKILKEMFKSFFTLIIRNLLKNKIFTVINIIGLGIALSICIVSFFNFMVNYEFNRTHKNFDKIYRINSFRDMQGREQEYGLVPASLDLAIRKDIPGIENSARIVTRTNNVKKGEDIYSLQLAYIDPRFLDIFTIPVVLGEKRSIENQGNVMISRKTATKIFGKENPVGKTVSIIKNGTKELAYTVGAVFADLPTNSSFRIDILTHFDNLLSMEETNDTDWKIWATAIFIQVNDKSRLPSIVQSLKSYLPVQNRAREDFRINRFKLVPLKELGSNCRVIWSPGLISNMHPAAVIAPPIMALLILLIACFNFTNTSIAIFSKRLKEIGLRKTFGGLRKQLVTQFMFETLMICFFALLVGIAFAAYLVPAWDNLWGGVLELKLSFTKYTFFWVFLILMLLLTGFISGVYPALYVSSFSPLKVLRGDSPFKRSGKLSSVLLTLQFAFSVIAVVMGIVFVKNAKFQDRLDLGYDKDQLIVLPIATEFFTTFRNEIITNPKIISAEGTQYHVGFGNYRRPVKDNEKRLEVDVLNIGPGYASTIGLRLAQGRLFDKTRAEADRTNNSIVINRKFADSFGWTDPVGRSVTLYDTTKLNVIGMIENFYLDAVWSEIEPAMLRLSPTDEYTVLAVRTKSEDLPGTLEYLSSKWKSMKTNYLYGGMTQDDIQLGESRRTNRNCIKIFFFLAFVATLLSLIGMYNNVSLEMISRTREIGIRKIQGAPFSVIVYLASRKYITVLLIASLLGSAGGYYLSQMLLGSIYKYYAEISSGIMLLAASLMFMATLLTIIFKITKAAMMNPVDSLRYE